MTSESDGRAEHPAAAAPADSGRQSWSRAVRRRRSLFLGGGAAALVLILIGVLVVARQGDGSRQAAGTAPWLSGASGPGVVDGQFGEGRGRPVDIAGTWSDNNEAMTQMWQLQPGAEFGSWDKPMDIAIGAIGDGETWAAAAQGAYDARWRASLTKLRELWGQRPGTLYIRFAHESNGNWYPWAVDASEKTDFVTAWKHFRELQQEIFPASELVFCVNRESVDTGFDWRESFPGAQYVDVLSVDYYNQYPYVDTESGWATSMFEMDQYGGPKGLQAHLDFARSVGLPLAVSEWSGVADKGDSPLFVQHMHDFFAINAGTGPGKLLYEILFDVDNSDYKGNFALMGDTRMPLSSAAYREAWRSPT
jgi:hypothetical protein